MSKITYPELLIWILLLACIACLFVFNASGAISGIILSGLIVMCLATLLSCFRSTCGLFSASAICLLALVFYSMAVPIHYLFYLDYPAQGISFVCNMCVIAVLGQLVGYYALETPNFVKKHSNKDDLWLGFSIIIIGFLALVVAISLTVGFSAYLNAGYAGRALLKREAGPIELGLYYLIVGYLFIANAWLYKEERKFHFWLTVFLIFFLLGFVAYVCILGIRRPSFFIVISCLFLYFLKVQGKVSKKIILLSGGCVFLFGIFASFRQVLSDHGAVEALNFVLENFDLTWLDLSVTELGAPFRAMLAIQDGWGAQGFLYGESYFDGLLNLFPSSILKFRDSLSVRYTNEFFSDDYIAIGGNMGFFPVAEAYLNFGAPGVFFEFFVLGILIKFIENRAIKRVDSIFSIIYAIMGPWFFFFLRTDFSSFLKSFFYSIIPVFIMHRLFHIIVYNWSNKEKLKTGMFYKKESNTNS